MAGWPGRKPLSRAENPAIAFICELEKQIRIGPFLRGEGKFAISDRAKAAHGNANPNATREGSTKGRKVWFLAADRPAHDSPQIPWTH